MPDCAGLVPLLASVKISVEVAPWSIGVGEKALVRLAVAAFTTRHWSVEALVAAVVVTFTAMLVKAAGLPAQLAFTIEAWLVRPETVTVQLAVPAVIAMPERPDRTRVPLLYAAVAGPEQPPEYATAGVVELRRRPEGSVSPTAMPDCAGFEPEFASVKTSVVVPPSAIDALPKVLATTAFDCVTPRHWSVPPGFALVAVTLAARLVNPAGLPTQLALVWVAALVRPASVTVQLAVPAVIARPVSPDTTRVPALYAAVAVPSSPPSTRPPAWRC